MKKITTWMPKETSDDFERDDVQLDEADALAITDTLLQIGEVL